MSVVQFALNSEHNGCQRMEEMCVQALTCAEIAVAGLNIVNKGNNARLTLEYKPYTPTFFFYHSAALLADATCKY